MPEKFSRDDFFTKCSEKYPKVTERDMLLFFEKELFQGRVMVLGNGLFKNLI